MRASSPLAGPPRFLTKLAGFAIARLPSRKQEKGLPLRVKMFSLFLARCGVEVRNDVQTFCLSKESDNILKISWIA